MTLFQGCVGRLHKAGLIKWYEMGILFWLDNFEMIFLKVMIFSIDPILFNKNLIFIFDNVMYFVCLGGCDGFIDNVMYFVCLGGRDGFIDNVMYFVC